MTLEKDTEIGQDIYQQLQRLLAKVKKRHGIDSGTAADYLLAGALFTAAHQRDLSIAETLELVELIADSVQNDELHPATRH